jgi:CTP:molybdopterin cytidylyltransferase MocA
MSPEHEPAPAVFAVLPAGGKSSRMGRPKLALPLGGRTVLDHVIDAVRQGGIEHILVIVGAHVPQVAAIADASGAHVLRLTEETADMRATVERGLAWIEERFRPEAEARWLLCPADHPALDPLIVRLLREARCATPGCSIVVPTFCRRRGHPVLIDWRHVAGIRILPAEVGLNVYLRQHATETLEVAVDAAAILWDLDTPEDYGRLRAAFGA